MSISLHHGDCLEIMPTLAAKSIDLILCDLPYAVTQNVWDSIVPLPALWEQYKRLVKPEAAIVLTAQIPFSVILGMSNLAWLKYEWIWEKTNVTGHLNAHVMPLKKHENILVFGVGKVKYNPLFTNKDSRKERIGNQRGKAGTSNYGTFTAIAPRTVPIDKEFPTTIIRCANAQHTMPAQQTLHPTQKPVELMEYLIRTYTDVGDTVLDNCMGSGTTGEACLRCNRNFIGIEKEKTYFDVASLRLANVTPGLQF